MNAIDWSLIDIHEEAPEKEPMRQYYFMAKAREWVKEKESMLGRPLKFCVTTFGCPIV